MSTPIISLCMIVRNEEDSIGRCLDSAARLADEIIIVDTGSNDQTVQIAKDYGATVLSYTWNDHFADARNYGIKHAAGEWILWLDADEELDTSSIPVIREAISQVKAQFILLPLHHYVGEELPADPDQLFLSYQARLFRNHAGIQFSNRIHETPQPTKDAEEIKIEYVKAPIHHYGYLKQIEAKKEKSARNIKLLKAANAETPNDPWVRYHLASEYYRTEDYPNAYEHINDAIFLFLQRQSLPPSLAYRLKYAILQAAGSQSELLQGIDKVLTIYPDYVDFHFTKGRLLYDLGRHEEAAKSFSTCLELGEDHPEHLIQKGTGSFLADDYLKKIKKAEKEKVNTYTKR